MNLYRVLVIVPFILFLLHFNSLSQIKDTTKSKLYEGEARRIIAEGLKTCQAYRLLEDLSLNIGPRLVGSPQAAKAVPRPQPTYIFSHPA